MKECVVAVLVVLAGAAGAIRTGAEGIDRILAVVDGVLIMQSDVAGATRLGLVSVPDGPDRVAAVLDRLIERRLILAEVDRYAAPEPPEPQGERALENIRARVGAEFDVILQQTGIGLDELRRQVRDDLRIESYLQQRFGAIQPSQSEIAQYYRDHAGEFLPRTLEQAHDAVRAAVITNRRAGMIRDWVAGLRRRANINVLPT